MLGQFRTYSCVIPLNGRPTRSFLHQRTRTSCFSGASARELTCLQRLRRHSRVAVRSLDRSTCRLPRRTFCVRAARRSLSSPNLRHALAGAMRELAADPEPPCGDGTFGSGVRRSASRQGAGPQEARGGDSRMRAATVDAPQARSLAVARPLARHASAVVGGFACAITATLGLMHGGYFSTAWGWGSLACLWIAARHASRLGSARAGQLGDRPRRIARSIPCLDGSVRDVVSGCTRGDPRARTGASLAECTRGGDAARAASHASGAWRRPRRNHDRLRLWPRNEVVSLASRWSL